MNPDISTITTYIYTQRQAGFSDVAIYESLLASGWPATVVQQELNMMPKGRQAQAQVQPAGYVNSALPQPFAQAAPKAGMFSGRLNRIGILMSFVYVIGFLLIPVILLLIFRNEPSLNMVAVVMGVVGTVFTIPIGLSTAIRRCHDLDQSGFFVLLGLIPFVGLILFFVYLLVPGTKGPNKYGEPDTSPSTIRKVIFGK